MTRHAEDLSARSRRGALTPDEADQLRQMIRSSAEARLLHRAGLDFDREDRVLAGDEVLAERIALRVLGEQAPPVRRRKRATTAWVAAALLAAGVAAAAAGPLIDRVTQSPARVRQGPVVHLRGAIGEPPAAAVPKTRPGPTEPTAAAANGAAPLPAVGASTADPQRDEPDHGEDRPGAAPFVTAGPGEGPRSGVVPPEGHPAEHAPNATRSRTTLPAASSANLYAEANRARRDGNVDQAIALYERLQERYPASLEAGAADMSLGLLLTQRGSTNAAVAHFHRYLARAPRGQLAPEALWALAEAYAKGGNAAQARRAWQDLIERFPDSPYARAARARLEPTPSR